MSLRSVGPYFAPIALPFAGWGGGNPLALCPRGTHAPGHSWSGSVRFRCADRAAVWKECQTQPTIYHQDGEQEGLRVPPAETTALPTFSVTLSSLLSVRNGMLSLGRCQLWGQRQGSSRGCQSQDSLSDKGLCGLRCLNERHWLVPMGVSGSGGATTLARTVGGISANNPTLC